MKVVDHAIQMELFLILISQKEAILQKKRKRRSDDRLCKKIAILKKKTPAKEN